MPTIKVLKFLLIWLLVFLIIAEVNTKRNHKNKRNKHASKTESERLANKHPSQITTPSLSSSMLITQPTVTTIDVTEEPDVICTREGVEALVQGYVLRGKISFSDVLPLTYGTYSDLEVVNILQDLLREANLPPLPFCKNGKITEKESETCELDIDLKNLTKTEDKLRQLEENGMVPLETTNKALRGVISSGQIKLMILKAEIAAGRISPNCLNQTESFDSDQENHCRNRSFILSQLPDYVQRLHHKGKMPSRVESAICESSMNTTEILELIVQDDGIIKTVLPKKIRKKFLNRAIPMQLKDFILSGKNTSEILEALELNDKSKQRSSSKTTSNNEKTITNITMNVDTDVIDPELCTAEGIQRLIEGYVFSGQLSMDKIFPIILGNYTDYEIGMLLNQTLVEEGFPPLPDCDVYINSKTKSGDKISEKCNLGFDVTNLKKSENKMKELEDKGKIPVGTTEKALRGDMSIAEVTQLIVKAEVASGQMPPSCMNASNLDGSAGFTKNTDKPDLRAIIMPHLPEELQAIIKEGKMPKKIEDAIFSGTHNQSEIMRMIVENDDVLKAMLPPMISDMLEDRPIPKSLKVLLMSGKNETEIRKEIENNDEILKDMIPAGTYYFYKLFKNEQNRKMNTAASSLMIASIIVAMIILGSSVSPKHIFDHARRLKGVAVALFVQYVIMPAVAFGLTRIFNLNEIAAMAMFVCGCCPSSNISNIFAYLMKGDMNLSILTTTSSSLFGFALMPLAIFIYSRFISPVNSAAVVPYSFIAFNLALTVLPTSVGAAIRHCRSKWIPTVRKIGATAFFGLIMASNITNSMLFGISMITYFPVSVLGCCIILPMFGYITGYVLAYLAQEKDKCRRAICIESGSQNVVLCTAVLQLAFPPEAIGVIFLAPVGYMFFQCIEGSIIVLIGRIYDRRKANNKNDQVKSEEESKFDVELGEKPKVKAQTKEHEPFIDGSNGIKKRTSTSA